MRCLIIAALALLGATAASAASNLIHSERSQYREVLVYEDAGMRCLCFTRGCAIGRQSCQVLADPQHMVFEYTKMMMAALYLVPEPHEILVIGLGGGTLPSALHRVVPAAHIDVVEIDPAVVRVAGQYFGFKSSPEVTVTTFDGRAYVRALLREGRKQYDLILLDAYERDYIPEHLLTREFLSQVRDLLRAGGVVAANTWSTSHLYSNESVTYHAVFGDFYNLKSGNRIILASNAPLPTMASIRQNSQRFKEAFAPFGFSSDSLLPMFSSEADWDSGARVLTDQYSPANLLNAGG
jgi:spermidine synthase